MNFSGPKITVKVLLKDLLVSLSTLYFFLLFGTIFYVTVDGLECLGFCKPSLKATTAWKGKGNGKIREGYFKFTSP